VLLDIWNFAQPAECRFLIEKHNATGDKIPNAIDAKVESELFIAEDFDYAALAHAISGSSLAKFIGELQEPSINGKHCIPWLGEVKVKEKVLRLCAEGRLAINLRGLELLQAQPGETADAAWMRIRGKLGSGKELEQTILLMPGATPQSGGAVPPITPQVTPVVEPSRGLPPNLFELTSQTSPGGPTLKPFGTPAKTPVNLLGEVEKWDITPATNVSNVNINASQMTGAQLIELLKKLPDGVTYSLNLEKKTK
jgi:hypothetical protein